MAAHDWYEGPDCTGPPIHEQQLWERDHMSPGFEQIWVKCKSASGGGLEANPNGLACSDLRSHICAHRRPCSHSLQACGTSLVKSGLRVVMLEVGYAEPPVNNTIHVFVQWASVGIEGQCKLVNTKLSYEALTLIGYR